MNRTIRNAVFLLILTMQFTLSIGKVSAQQAENKSYNWYDSITYAEYLNGSWERVIHHGNQAIKAGHDYLYLRLRLGFAYYYSTNYRLAAEQFSKALKFNSADTLAAQYFNLSCKYGGRANENYQIKNQPRPFKCIESINSNAGFADYSQKIDYKITDSTQIYNELDRPRFLSYLDFGIKMNVAKSFSMFLSANQYNFKGTKGFSYYTSDATRDSTVTTDYGHYYTYLFQNSLKNSEFEISTKQNAFYLQGSYYPIRGLKIVPAVQFLQIEKNNIYAYPDSTLKTDTAWFNKYDTSWHTFDYTNHGYKFARNDTSYFDFVASLAVYKDLGCFNIGINGSIARLYNQKIKQFGVSILWYPFGNTNLYTSASFSRKFSQADNSIISDFLIGARILKKSWLEGSYTLGKLSAFSELNSYLVYNQPYLISNRWGFTFYQLIYNTLSANIGFKHNQIQANEITYIQSTNGLIAATIHPTINYFTLNAGLQWKF